MNIIIKGDTWEYACDAYTFEQIRDFVDAIEKTIIDNNLNIKTGK